MDHDWSDNILITKLPAEPQTGDELNAITANLAFDTPKSDLIVDLGAVDRPTRRTLRQLTTLCRVLNDRGYRCVFYNLNAAARRIFHLHGFDRILHDRILQIDNISEIVLKPSLEQAGSGILEIRSLSNNRPLERRKYFRLKIPWWLQVDVLLWHGGRCDDYHKQLQGHFWYGRLVDISKGGIQIAIEATEDAILGKGRLMGLEFRPNPAEPLLVFDAQIKEVLPTANSRNVCLGLSFIGLQTNPEGRKALEKLYNPEGTYYQAKENMAI